MIIEKSIDCLGVVLLYSIINEIESLVKALKVDFVTKRISPEILLEYYETRSLATEILIKCKKVLYNLLV